MALWFTSDQHFGHRNIIAYSGRPFRDVSHMTEELIRRHNEVVADNDEVVHLGDFSLDDRLVEKMLKRLRGRHYLVAGNHDKCHPVHKRHQREVRAYERYGFLSIATETRMDLGSGWAKLHHMPYVGDHTEKQRYSEWRPNPDGEKILLHGHVHDKWRFRKVAGNPIMCNVGVDQWDFAPVSMAQIFEQIEREGIEL